MFAVNLIRDALTYPTQCNNAITQKWMKWRYLPTAKMQECSSYDLGLELSHKQLQHFQSPIVTQFISFPLDVHNLQAHKRAFMDIAGFTGVAGVIDGTHICIIPPSETRYPSISTQIVFSVDYKILDIAENGQAQHMMPEYCLTVWEWPETGFWRTLCANMLPLVRGQWLSILTMASCTLLSSRLGTTATLQQ